MMKASLEGEGSTHPRGSSYFVSILLGFLIMGYNSAADVASGGCGGAATECFIPAHARATVVADLNDHAVRLMKRRECYRLRRRCVG
jgi:hypothetical protein